MASIKVKAIARGFFGRTIRVGEVFDIPEELLGSWMVPVDAKDRERLAAKLATFKRAGLTKAVPGTVPITTGPGVPMALSRAPVATGKEPKGNAPAGDAKGGKEPQGKQPAGDAKGDPPKP